MAGPSYVRRLLGEQRKRMVGSLMRYIEAEVYPELSPAQRTALREKVLAAAGAYHDVTLDMLAASVDEGTSEINQAVLDAIDRLGREIRNS